MGRDTNANNSQENIYPNSSYNDHRYNKSYPKERYACDLKRNAYSLLRVIIFNILTENAVFAQPIVEFFTTVGKTQGCQQNKWCGWQNRNDYTHSPKP